MHTGALFEFLKSIKYFQKKYLRVDNNTHYNSAKFYLQIPYILDAAKKTNITKIGNTVAHSKLHCSHTDLHVFSFLLRLEYMVFAHVFLLAFNNYYLYPGIFSIF
jgi:hypothetical protein